MDFRFGEEQTALRGLAREILENEVSVERLKEVEQGADWLDRRTWERLAEANLLGLAVPEELGGMGMGFLELCLLLQEVGRAVAPLPALPALVLGGLPIARFGSELQRKEWLTPLARGELVLTGAFEPGWPVTARRDADGFALDGSLRQVPAVHLARRVLVPARLDGETAVFLLDPGAAGVASERRLTSRHEPVFALTLEAAHVAEADVLRGRGIGDWIVERALVACAATQVGVCERALEITTRYLKQREQFGAPLGALPPVQHRCADAYIALDCMRWVTWQAAWKLGEERPAPRDARVAKFWAADAGSRITTATQHLHGGMGVDMDYPIHRYFLWAKALELAYGAATPQLLALGDDMALAGPEDRA
jgi:alkylation response protein AidB-like acyl-CoA dehydrogenase